MPFNGTSDAGDQNKNEWVAVVSYLNKVWLLPGHDMRPFV